MSSREHAERWGPVLTPARGQVELGETWSYKVHAWSPEMVFFFASEVLNTCLTHRVLHTTTCSTNKLMETSLGH